MIWAHCTKKNKLSTPSQFSLENPALRSGRLTQTADASPSVFGFKKTRFARGSSGEAAPIIAFGNLADSPEDKSSGVDASCTLLGKQRNVTNRNRHCVASSAKFSPVFTSLIIYTSSLVMFYSGTLL